MEVLGPLGWSTSYYHLDNIIVSDGEVVARNQPIANYANNRSQALCEGGQADLPHVHFSLLRDGRYVTLRGAALSGWRVHPGRFSYDTNCDFFWLERGATRHCARIPLYNEGIRRNFALDVTLEGSGAVTSDPPGIDCGDDIVVSKRAL